MNTNNQINYVEFLLWDKAKTKSFYQNCFGWEFEDWGPGYISFRGAGLEGGFNGESDRPLTQPGTLIVLYSDDLKAIHSKVKKEGGTIKQEPYDFPGGRRFHFEDPNGNELAIWSAG